MMLFHMRLQNIQIMMVHNEGESARNIQLFWVFFEKIRV